MTPQGFLTPVGPTFPQDVRVTGGDQPRTRPERTAFPQGYILYIYIYIYVYIYIYRQAQTEAIYVHFNYKRTISAPSSAAEAAALISAASSAALSV